MIRATAALSTEAAAIRAAMDVARRINEGLDGAEADFCVVFATEHHRDGLPQMLETLRLALGTPYVVGGSGAAVIAEGREIEDGPALGVLAVTSDQIKATPFLGKAEGDNPGFDAGRRIGERLIGSRRTEDLMLVWSDPTACRLDRLVRGLESVLGSVPCVGGASAVSGNDGKTYQFCGEDCLDAAAAGVRLGGNFDLRIARTRGFRAVGAPTRITGAHQNLLMELDGRPAYSVLRERVPRDRRDGPVRGNLFVAAADGSAASRGSEVSDPIRPVLEVDREAGVVALDQGFEEGQSIVFAVHDSGAAREDLARQLRALNPAQTGRRYRFGLYFNCVARGSRLYEEPDVDIRMLQAAIPEVPILGFAGHAELAPLAGTNELHLYSGVLVLIGE